MIVLHGVELQNPAGRQERAAGDKKTTPVLPAVISDPLYSSGRPSVGCAPGLCRNKNGRSSPDDQKTDNGRQASI